MAGQPNPYPGLSTVPDQATRQVIKLTMDRLGNLEQQILGLGALTKPLTANLDAAGKLVQNLAAPSADADAVNYLTLKQYVASAIANIPASGSGTAGVTSLAGSTGISVSAATGAVTLGNTGVTSIIAGTNVSISGATGAVTISVTAGAGGVTDITGTANQITASPASGSVVLSTPQNIATTSTPQFAALGIGGVAGAASTLKIYGTGSGSIIFTVPAAAGANTLTFPAGTTDFSATGGTDRFLKQNAAGAAITVVTLASANLSDSANIPLINANNSFTGSGTTTFGATTLTVTGIGPHAFGGTVDTDTQWTLRGTRSAGHTCLNVQTAFTPSNATGAGTLLSVTGSVNEPAGGDAYGLHIAPTLNKAGSGTHAIFAGTYLAVPTIGAGAATLTTAATLYIKGAPSVGTNQRAISVEAGTAYFGGGITMGGQIQFFSSSTGAGTPLLATNCPAVTATAPYVWLKCLSDDGSQVYVPCWK